MDCNLKAQLGEVFFLKERPIFDRSSGLVSLDLPAVRVKDTIRNTVGATHIQIALVAVEFDPDCSSNNQSVSVRSDYLDMNSNKRITADRLSTEFVVRAQSTVILLLNIQYFQYANDAYYPLHNGENNVLSIVEVDTPT